LTSWPIAGADAKSNRLTVFAWIDLNAIPHWNADKYGNSDSNSGLYRSKCAGASSDAILIDA
jgi:hypothetical protein